MILGRFSDFPAFFHKQTPTWSHFSTILKTHNERVNPFLIYPKERIITDDGHRPICAGEYSLVWDGDTVILSVSDGAGGSETISVALDER